MATKDELEQYLKLLPDSVSKHLTVVEIEGGGLNLMHLSDNPKIKEFIPFVTQRTANNENRTVPRISTAPTLLGCFVGYCAAAGDFGWPERDDGSFVQGWTLYGIPCGFAVKPAARLLHDQKNSDEHWVITYSADTRVFTPVKLAKCFYKTITQISRPKMRPTEVCTILVEVFDKPVVFSKRFTLTPGYWEVTGPEPSNFVESWKDDAEFKIKPISKGEYQAAKKLSVDMQSLPHSFKW